MRTVSRSVSPSRLSPSRSPRRRPGGPQPRRRRSPAARRRTSTWSRTGRLTLGTDNPAFPPWWGGGRDAKPWKIIEPDERQGLRVGGRVRGREAARLREARRSTGGACRSASRIAPGQEALRLLHRPGLVLPRAREGGRLQRRRTTTSTRPSSGSRRTRSRRCSSIAGLEAVQARRAGRDDELQVHRQLHQAVAAARASTTRTNDADARRSRTARSTASSSTSRARAYVTGVQVPTATVVGRLPSRGAQEHFGLVFQKGNPLVGCVNKAIDAAARERDAAGGSSARWLGGGGRSRS